MTSNSKIEMRGSPAFWGLAALIFGIAAEIAYFGAAVVDIVPQSYQILLFFAFGPLLALSVYALGLWLARISHDGLILRLGVMSMVIAAVLTNVMALIQVASAQIIRERINEADIQQVEETLAEASWGVNAVQLSLDLAFDIWVSLGAMLMGVALMTRLAWRPIVGLLGVAAGAITLIENFAYFPHPPAEAGGVDYGPAIGIWFFLVMLLVLHRIVYIRD